jgi:hypothetical protein
MIHLTFSPGNRQPHTKILGRNRKGLRNYGNGAVENDIWAGMKEASKNASLKS